MFNSFSYLIWILTTSLQIAVISGLVRKRLFRSLPIFRIYTAFAICRAVGLSAVLIGRNPAAYFYAYWACEFVSLILGLLMIREILIALLHEKPYWRTPVMRIFQVSSAVLILVSVALSSRNMSSDSAQVTNTVLAMERALRLIQCGLLVFVLLFSGVLRLTWRHYLFGVTAGMAVIASSSLAVITLRLYFGRIADQQTLLLTPASYLLAASVWTFYIWSSQTQTSDRREISSDEISKLGQWKEALARVRFS